MHQRPLEAEDWETAREKFTLVIDELPDDPAGPARLSEWERATDD